MSSTPRLGLNKPDIGSTNWGTDVNNNWDTIDSAGDYILIRDVKSAGSHGGTFTSGAWRTRDLTEETVDVGNHASISSNQITLEAGTYRYRISCPAFACKYHQARLYNVSDTTVVTNSEGCSHWSQTDGKASNNSIIVGRFTIDSQKTFEIQHRCSETRSLNGLGVAPGWQQEVFTVAEFWFEV